MLWVGFEYYMVWVEYCEGRVVFVDKCCILNLVFEGCGFMEV